MLSKQDTERLKELGIDVDALVKAHTATEEVAITIPSGKLLTDEQLAERDENIGAQREKIGESKAAAIAKSEFKKRGIDVKGDRWGDMVNEINEAINKDKEAKVTQLQEQNNLLLKDVETYKTKIEEVEGNAKRIISETNVLNSLPDNPLGLSKKETLELMKMRGYTHEDTDKGTIWKKNGEVYKDGSTHAPMVGEQAVKAIFGELNWATQAGNAGGRNIGGTGSGNEGTAATFSQAKKQWQEANPNKSVISPEFEAHVESIAKANPAFDYSK
jgi:hypothetical protein